MSYSRVREALPASHRCSTPLVSRQISQESTVPRRTSSIGVPAGRLSSSHRILGAENIGSIRQPRSRIHQLPVLLAEGLTTPGRRTPVLPADHRAQWRPGAGSPADHRLPLSRECDADDLGIRCVLQTGRHCLEHARPDPVGVLFYPAEGAEMRYRLALNRQTPCDRPR